MYRTAQQLRDDAIAIWRAGVEAVDSARLMRDNVRIEGDHLCIGDEEISLRDIDRIVVVGGGKAGTGMAKGLIEALGESVIREKHVTGWLNVPADCVQALPPITLHSARPAGVNEPTPEGVFGTDTILSMVAAMGPRDLCLCLISGGGSALLPAPVRGVSLQEKLAITRHLSAAGANIQELNTVRGMISRFKAGGLSRVCRAGRLVSLVISDVLGDPLDVIASGPTVEPSFTAADASSVLRKYYSDVEQIPAAVRSYLSARSQDPQEPSAPAQHVSNIVIGNNAVAVDAAGIEAERRGYSHAMFASRTLEGCAEQVGRNHAEIAKRMRREIGPDGLISGGEPTVRLVPAPERGRGGRNQQLVLAATEHLSQFLHGGTDKKNPFDGIVILAGGTDGEDGPTDAAGAFMDAVAWSELQRLNLQPATYLRRNDAYSLFEQVGTLIKTGPTHTNVCDLRVVLVSHDN